jgi:hypothetical protein
VPIATGPRTGPARPAIFPTVADGGVIRATGEDDHGQGSRSQRERNAFAVDEASALAELELAWADGGYNGFSADGGTTWCAISSAGDVLTGATVDDLNRVIRAHWQAMQ